ncbi:stalk domain-containing protein [Paenibacillus sp.]|uniref:stalk domain-containing protein n=1 Tax=Paenibacillus sp. TaxID=58172 RepID=UPI002D2FF71E|nr:stalk domain-containing protein [Paenibacillus sp.]HZG57668.1 stalk domain-containing protein [Paenibacillus sp.]
MGKRSALFALIVTLVFGLFGGTASAVPSAAMKVWLYVDQKQAFVNGAPFELTSPATVYNGKMYVPVKFLGDTFGFPVQFDMATNTIALQAGKTDVLIDLTTRTTLIDGMPGAFQPTFEISQDGKLMAQLTWIMDRIGATYSYDAQLSRVEVVYAPWSAELPAAREGKPVAKFTFGKTSYKMGEKIQYIDLSYDVEGDGIEFAAWKGKQDAFFEPGVKTVSLQVTDSKGNVSDWYSKTITITNETMYSPVQFQMQHAKLQSFIKLDAAQLNQHIRSAQKLGMASTQVPGRKLLVSDSPETITQYGALYRDTVDGKARLYANHINEMDEDVQFAIIATNQGDDPVTIKTTRQGEVYPSVFVHLFGYQASVDFLVGDANKPELTVKPGESKAYAYLPKLTKGQGINLIYDIETSGDVAITFAAMRPGDPMDAALSYPELPFAGHIRGSFPFSEIRMEADADGTKVAKRFTVGDNVDDPFVRGFDPFRNEFVSLDGNYGMMYNIRVKNPGKSAIVLLARGGAYKGPLKINGEMVLAPASGVLTALDGVFLLYRTTGTEEYVDIEFTPAAGSYLPLDFIFYPLK